MAKRLAAGVCLVAVLATSCQRSTTQATQQQGQEVKEPPAVSIVAHRGSGFDRNDPEGPPENTLSAFRYGFEQGADAVELDVVISKDGHPIVIHEETTDRTTNRKGAVGEMTVKELQSLDAGLWKGERWKGEHLPTLSEALETVPRDKAIVVELKQGPQAVPPVVESVNASHLRPDQVVFISFNVDTIIAMKKAMPKHEAYWLVTFLPSWDVGGWTQDYMAGPGDGTSVLEQADIGALIKRAKDANLDGLDTLFATPPGFPEAMASAGLKWIVWTVNTEDVTNNVATNGVTAITTDVTGKMRDYFRDIGIEQVPLAR